MQARPARVNASRSRQVTRGDWDPRVVYCGNDEVFGQVVADIGRLDADEQDQIAEVVLAYLLEKENPPCCRCFFQRQ
jgi:hypothetical protein